MSKINDANVKGVYFDNHMQRWMGRIQRNGQTFRKGFVNKVDAINYRKSLELEFDSDLDFGDAEIRPSNFCFKDETFEMLYLGHKQTFVKKNIKEAEATTDSFWTKQIHFRVIYKDNVTVVIFDNGIKGVAKCGRGDTFSRKMGLEYAFGRGYGEYLLDKYRV